ncbi:MAG: hypothetical protein KDK78_12460 [Chlamydiia bacterium]|nr:hypothetical protein [Chlamydiia bacterium]
MRKPRGPRALLRTGRSEGDLYHFFLQQQQVYWDQHLRRQADQRKMLMWLEGQHEEFRIRRTSRDLTTRVRATYVRHSNLGPFGGKTS